MEEGELAEYGNSNEFPSLFLWKNREKADRKGQHELIQSYGLHGEGITFYDSHSTAAMLHVLLAKVMMLY